MKLVSFFIWPRGSSENIFTIKSLAHLKVRGERKKLVIKKLSANQEEKQLKLPLNLKFSRGALENLFKT